MHILERLMQKASEAYRSYRFSATEVHVHPHTAQDLIHQAGQDLIYIEAGGYRLVLPTGTVTLVASETVPPGSLQLRRPDPREPVLRGRDPIR